MAYIPNDQIGTLEKAAKIALKHGVIFSQRMKCFIGDPVQADKATTEMLAWVQKERDLDFRAERRV